MSDPVENPAATRKSGCGTCRVLLRLLVLFCIGMTLSVFIALACSILPDPSKASWTSTAVNGKPVLRGWLWEPPAGNPKEPNFYSSSDPCIGYHVDMVSWGEPTGPGMLTQLSYIQNQYTAGLPLTAFQARHDRPEFPQPRWHIGRFRFYGLDWGATWGPSTPWGGIVAIVPLNPYWPGLIADSLLIGVCGGTLVIYIAGTRRRRRNARGQCLKCGYALAGLSKCPECGSESSAAA